MTQQDSRLIGIAAALAAALSAAAGAASANDSSATLGAGGIVLTTSEEVALEREDLYLSAQEVRVRYEFRNVTDRDILTTVAFPLPRIDLWALAETSIERPSPDPVNFVDFTVTVDGERLRSTVQVRAFHESEDITAFLSARGLKLSFFEDGFHEALLALDEAGRKELADRGYADFDDDETVYAHWVVETMLHWPQSFPANAVVTVEHTYKPVVGQSFVSKYTLRDEGGLAEFCIDEATARAIDKRIKQRSTTAEEEGVMIARNLDYILQTANNWRGPIGRFRLTLDKGAPDRILSLCFDGELEKTTPTTFVAEITDYVPTSDLRVLILE